MKNLGVAYDSYRGTARGIMPKEFCKACRLQTSITCIVKTYGEESCIMLVKYWCDKMKFLYDVWSRAGGSAVNWADELRHYVEPPAIVTLFNSSTTAVLRNRIKSIGTIIPKQYKNGRLIDPYPEAYNEFKEMSADFICYQYASIVS